MDEEIQKGTLTTKERAIIARSLAALILTESSIQRPLANLANGIKNLRLKSTLLIISEEVKESSVASTIIKREQLFGSLFTEMVKIGHSSGSLPVMLVRLAEYYDQQHTLFRTIVRKIRPPLIISATSIGALISVTAFLIPDIIDKIAATAVPVPAATGIALKTIALFQKAFVPSLIFLPIFFCLTLAVTLFLGRYSSYEKIIWHFPLIGEFIRISRLERFFSALSATVSNGIPEKKALCLSAHESHSRNIIHLLHSAAGRSSVETLEAISGHLEKQHILPPLLKETLRPAGSIYEKATVLKKMAAFYQEIMLSLISPALIILQPLSVMVTGLLILTLIIALYLPFIK